MMVLGFYINVMFLHLKNVLSWEIFVLGISFYQPASVDNNLNLLLFDEIQVWVENLVSLNAGNLLNLLTSCGLNKEIVLT